MVLKLDSYLFSTNMLLIYEYALLFCIYASCNLEKKKIWASN